MARTPDLALDLLRHGYGALPRLRDRAGDAAVADATLLGRHALVVTGPDAVRRFYDQTLIRRHRAVPGPLALQLFGPGAIHGLDGEEHAHRKALFLDLLDQDAATRIAELARANLHAQLGRHSGGTCRVFDLLVQAYGEAVLEWSGAHIADPAAMSERLARIVDGFGGARGAYVRSWGARLRAHHWARGQIRSARAHSAGPARPVEVIARWRRCSGGLLGVDVAATELLNVLRPAVAVAYLGAFAVCALDENPQWRARLAPADAGELRTVFAQEVRRTSPFVPALVGRTTRDTEWGGHRLHRGGRVILDVPGTDLDPSVWPAPGRFDPERFVGRSIDPDELVPQGGGDLASGHRCPGEDITMRLLETTLQVFVTADWGVVARGHDLTRIPAREDLAVRLTHVSRAVLTH